MIGGILGVPLGVFFLHNVDPQRFRLLLGVLLIGYCMFALFASHSMVVTRGGRGLDAVFGLFGGVLGGLGGMTAIHAGDLDADARLEARSQARDDASLHHLNARRDDWRNRHDVH